MSGEREAFSEELVSAKGQTGRLGADIAGTQSELNDLTEQVNCLLRAQGRGELQLIDTSWLSSFQDELEQQIEIPEVLRQAERLPKLSTQDIVACCACGLLASLADIFLVGTPELRNGAISGAPIQEWLRKIDGDSGIFKWFSEHCKVPYDISAVKDTVYPLNHRLRSLAHDPLFGALFALLDLCMGTTTCINNDGQLVMLLSPKGRADEKAPLFLLYYLGHLISDAFTSCGIPVPGWFLTQFFASEDGDSLARAAEEMYKSGMDFRQLMSMEASTQLGICLTELYFSLAYPKEPTQLGAEGELQELRRQLLHRELRLVTGGVSSAGNIVKILLPPAFGNLAGINLAQWREFAWQGILTLKAATRDMSTETVIENRNNINRMWETLQEEI